MEGYTGDPNAYKPIQEDPVVLDFTGCRYLGEIHRVLKEGLGLPDYYGENWDALWDLTRDFRDYPIRIELRGLGSLPKELGAQLLALRQVFWAVSRDAPHIVFDYID